MDTNILMGILGQDPGSTASATPQYATSAPAPASSGAVAYSGSDPELRFYAEQGIDPEIIRAKRWDALQNMSIALMAGSGRGIDGSRLGENMIKAYETGNDIKPILDTKHSANQTALARAKLSLEQQKLAMEVAAQQREAAASQAFQDWITKGSGSSPAPAATASSPGLAPVSSPVSSAASAPTAALAASAAPAPTPSTDSVITPNGPVAPSAPVIDTRQAANVVAAQQGSPAAQQALIDRLSPDQRRLIGITAMTDRKSAEKMLWDFSLKNVYTPPSDNGAGYITQMDQYGQMHSVGHMPTQAQTDTAALHKGSIDAGFTESQKQLDFARDRQKAAEDAFRQQGIQNAQGDYTAGRTALVDGQKEAKAANDTIEAINAARELINGGVYSGSQMALAKSRADALLAQFGFDNLVGSGDQAARTSALQSVGRQLAKSMVKGLGANPTDADLRAAAEMAGANPGALTEQQMLRIFQENERVSAAKIKDYNDRRSTFASQLPQAERTRIDANFPAVSDPGRYHQTVTMPNGEMRRVYTDRNGQYLRHEVMNPRDAR
ncbi:hypothetical protein FF100_21985 [Methylobacterium terricola]|uniref:Uncharacterized protein n=1 Tax=Methylobacterium terricola TaxID=2583531 RepID=A0A5C4LC68_9HYPH|nr:hypothetical protein [Methylobacterium terricola]TNC10823.1 hypothetical protein FF100_21985 [Methylobacterium terricola]